MNIKKLFLFLIFSMQLFSCAEYKVDQGTAKQYYFSSGFALVYDDNLYNQKVVNRKLNNDELFVMHSSLKKKYTSKNYKSY